MSRTAVELDSGLLVEVSKLFGTSTATDTVNAALREVLETRRRAIALTRLRVAAADSAVDLEPLADKEQYRP